MVPRPYYYPLTTPGSQTPSITGYCCGGASGKLKIAREGLYVIKRTPGNSSNYTNWDKSKFTAQWRLTGDFLLCTWYMYWYRCSHMLVGGSTPQGLSHGYYSSREARRRNLNRFWSLSHFHPVIVGMEDLGMDSVPRYTPHHTRWRCVPSDWNWNDRHNYPPSSAQSTVVLKYWREPVALPTSWLVKPAALYVSLPNRWSFHIGTMS